MDFSKQIFYSYKNVEEVYKIDISNSAKTELEALYTK